ncbi:conserved membrane hypothetical protein [uncultured Desulfobacterium sp.]|uniref:Major facilitator superfamily (MFS) profile domain-containing protein n=1 Tax=uncultured Desulfobacterium sp. TaxID=201089 RepID=A0A445MRV4_9BACT|nr:conserved membrane hypothetical protein [uncultured Desulfobacterium sp.]
MHNLPNSLKTGLAALGSFRVLPVGIWALGFVSMFMDISSELIHSLLPVFMSSVLGASMTDIGLIEGIAEAAAAIIKVFSGAISDFIGKRKFLAVLGYGLAAFTKPVFPLATTIGWVFVARFIDRVGKGIRSAPRDALVADIAPLEMRGAAYGLRQSLDSIGAFFGPLAAVVFMLLFAGDIKSVLWVAVVPGFISVLLLVSFVHDPERAAGHSGKEGPLSFGDAMRLPVDYWLIVLLGAVFTLARFSEAFLVLRAQDVGLSLGYVPMVFVVMNITYTLSSYPAGVAADQFSSRTILISGLVMLAAADLALAGAASPLLVFIGAGLWGVHMGLTQGLFAKLVADTAPSVLRGTAFGIFNLVSGISLLLASLIAGMLWSAFGAPSTFIAGAVFVTISVFGLLFYRRSPHRREEGRKDSDVGYKR